MNENLTKIQQKITENSVRIQLGNNKLRYCDKKCWVLENNDLNIAANEIIKLTKENEKLHNELNIKDEEYIELENQLHETQQLKEIALTMVCLYCLNASHILF